MIWRCSLEEINVKGRSLNDLAALCHSIAKEKGFWDEKRNIGEALMLIVTELAEGMEAYRKQDQENFKEELADTFIRLLDLCGGLNIDIEEEIHKKCLKNKNRPYKHGKIC
ncbi:MAG: nucleotide pyrophosphohydrolase [Candidatus Omnitrophica bacterium]|nr:nucleotide pyrophosphohydrolase [Candidatus Omnitrophota bacterium]